MTPFNTSVRIGICGAGAMGAGIAQVAAQAGHQLVVYDSDAGSLTRGQANVAKGAAALLKRGKIDTREAHAMNARITWTDDMNALAGCGLIIEAIIESLEIKTDLFQNLEALTDKTCVLATNTSSLSVSSLAANLKRPENFLGLHFFNPAPVMKLVEVIPGLQTSRNIGAACFALMQAWGKQAVMAKDVPGFIVNRVARPFYGEGWQAYEEGASDAATIDFLLRDLAGFKMGPLELGDLIGHDINSKAAISVYNSYYGRTRFRPSLLQAQLAQSGRLGRKSGKGIYDYTNQAGKPDPTFQPAARANTIIRGPKTDMFSHIGSTPKIDNSLPDQFCLVDDVLIGFSNGRSAHAMASIRKGHAAVLDYVMDINAASALAYSASSKKADLAARGFISALGKKPIRFQDRPGAIVFRVILQLLNAACDAVRDQVASPEAIDTALKFGVNYPFGPMAWVKDYGVETAIHALQAIAEETGEHEFYLPNQVLRAMI